MHRIDRNRVSGLLVISEPTQRIITERIRSHRTDDPSISTEIRSMHRKVRWRSPKKCSVWVNIPKDFSETYNKFSAIF
jgi:hypothetical protein